MIDYEIEFSDGIGFYSSNGKSGFGYKESTVKDTTTVVFNKSKTMVSYIKPEKGVLIFKNVSGEIFDLVMRYKFSLKNVKNICLDGKPLNHTSSNVYRVLNGQPLEIEFKNLQKIKLDYSIHHDSKMSDGSYYRDEKDSWIIHFRLVAYNKKSLNLGSRGYLKNCVRFLQNYPILLTCNKLNSKVLKHYFLRPELQPISNPIQRRLWNISFIPVRKLTSQNLEFKSIILAQ